MLLLWLLCILLVVAFAVDQGMQKKDNTQQVTNENKPVIQQDNGEEEK